MNRRGNAVDMSGPLMAQACAGVKGTVAVPGDKSISHRALMLGALAEGTTTITGLLEGDDVLHTAAAMRTLGADIEVDEREDQHGGGVQRVWSVAGIGGTTRPRPSPDLRLYFGNAGTGARLALGLVAGLGQGARFDGDVSLRARPMGRILTPLRQMGLIAVADDDKLPVTLSPRGDAHLKAIDYTLPVASAQVKSAILLAGLNARGTTRIVEPALSRDHTENMLTAFGATLMRNAPSNAEDPKEASTIITLDGGQRLKACAVRVPGDPSSAAFLLVLGLIAQNAHITVTNVLLNPLRAGLFETLQEMGADLTISDVETQNGEHIGTVTARSSQLRGVKVPAIRAPAMIDEYPILAVAAAFATGRTHMTGIGEMRVKESDRIAATEAGLRANGVTCESGPDWLAVEGTGAAKGGGSVATHHDHRIAMAFLVMGCAATNPVRVDSGAMIATSFPNFCALMNGLGADIHACS